MSRREDEESVYRAALVGLQRWLGKARDAVMKPWFQYKMQKLNVTVEYMVNVYQERHEILPPQTQMTLVPDMETK